MFASGVAASVTTCTALVARLNVLSPSWPAPLLPQHHTPPLRIAHVWLLPAEIAVASLIGPAESVAWTKAALPEPELPIPSWPTSFCPAHHTVPSCRSMQLCRRPSATSVMQSPAHVPFEQ